MLESLVELLVGLFFDRSDLIDRFLYRWLDYRGPSSGQSWKRQGEYQWVGSA